MQFGQLMLMFFNIFTFNFIDAEIDGFLDAQLAIVKLIGFSLRRLDAII